MLCFILAVTEDGSFCHQSDENFLGDLQKLRDEMQEKLSKVVKKATDQGAHTTEEQYSAAIEKVARSPPAPLAPPRTHPAATQHTQRKRKRMRRRRGSRSKGVCHPAAATTTTATTTTTASAADVVPWETEVPQSSISRSRALELPTLPPAMQESGYIRPASTRRARQTAGRQTTSRTHRASRPPSSTSQYIPFLAPDHRTPKPRESQKLSPSKARTISKTSSFSWKNLDSQMTVQHSPQFGGRILRL